MPRVRARGTTKGRCAIALKAGKRDIARLAEVLDADYQSVEEAAAAVMAEAWDIYEAKAKFTVAGQLAYSAGPLDPTDDGAAKVVLGAYGTEKQALSAAESLVYSAATHETFRAWVLPMFHGTPAAFYKERQSARKRADLGMSDAEGLAHRIAWQNAHPDQPREAYPGPPEPDPRTDCPICGASPEEEAP